LNSWKNYFSWLENVQGGNSVRQTEICTTEPLIPKASSFVAEIAIEKLPGIDQFPVELIEARDVTLYSEIHKHVILFGITKNFHGSGMNLLLYLFVRNVTDCKSWKWQ
jgi:hypothetical protein